MRRRTKLRLAVLGGMLAGTLAAAWLMDALEAVARWMLMNWFLLDEGHAAAQAPAMSGVLIAAVFFVGVCIYNPWDETAHRRKASQNRGDKPLNLTVRSWRRGSIAPISRGAKNQGKKRVS